MAFRAADGADPRALCQRRLSEVEQAVIDAGPDEVALIIAEPVQNAGGCLVPPPGYWRGLRDIADRYGIFRMADEVICGCGRLGEWIATSREDVVPDLFERDGVLANVHRLTPHLAQRLDTLRCARR